MIAKNGDTLKREAVTGASHKRQLIFLAFDDLLPLVIQVRNAQL